jgi:hypothetical protein
LIDDETGHRPADDHERREAVIRQLELMVRDGHTLEKARRDLIALLGLDVGRVDEAVTLVRQRMEEVRNRDIPRTMTAEGRESWYLGPDLDRDVFWPALVRHLAPGFDEDSLDDLDAASTKVVSMLEHPGTGSFHTKGVVLGYVQSGKTTNFTATIAKAADAGYVNELARDTAKAVAALRDPARHEFRIECGPAVPDGPTEPYDPATSPDWCGWPGQHRRPAAPATPTTGNSPTPSLKSRGTARWSRCIKPRRTRPGRSGKSATRLAGPRRDPGRPRLLSPQASRTRSAPRPLARP